MAYKDPHDPRLLKKRREHYYNNKEAYISRARAQDIVLREYVREQKANPCTDCGESYPYYVMQFDHIGDDKLENIAVLVNKGSMPKLVAEIAKCELVCANCHAERTHQRNLSQPRQTDSDVLE